MARKVRKKLGEIIVEQGLATEEVVAAADEHGMALVFTGERHFRH